MARTICIKATHVWFVLYCAACAALFGQPLFQLGRLSLTNDSYSHILLIPVISGYFVYLGRREIRHEAKAELLYCGPLLLIAVISWYLGYHFSARLSENDRLSLIMLSFVSLLVGGFIALYGRRAASVVRFPLLVLLLMVPFPDVVLNGVVSGLQKGSAGIVDFLFSVFNVPFLRYGLVFQLPGVAIEIAKECSGIRSSIALSIVSL